jgi:hypothetical protein
MADTRLDDDNTKPSNTEPGDGPHDTTDPSEFASTVIPNPGPEALRTGTVNSARPIPNPQGPTPKVEQSEHRIERYTAFRPDGTEVEVVKDLDADDPATSTRLSGSSGRRAEPAADTGAFTTRDRRRSDGN